MQSKAIWITWENQRRNREISKAIGVKLFQMAEIEEIGNPLKKYLVGLTKTVLLLIQKRPRVVFCQNPSVILTLFLVLFKQLIRMTRIRVCVDAHNVGLFPKEGQSAILGILSTFVQRKADLTIVTNEGLAHHVECNGGRAFILQDKIPHLPEEEPQHLKGKFNILFICSYASDEPYQLVFDAAQNLDPSIYVYVTGNYKRRAIDPLNMPQNVILLGYIPEEEYIRMLYSVDATIDLTTRENCLVCGAYESVAVEKPMILSETDALKDYFSMGTVYTKNTIEGIRNAILEVIERKDELADQLRELKALKQLDWDSKRENLEILLLAWN